MVKARIPRAASYFPLKRVSLRERGGWVISALVRCTHLVLQCINCPRLEI
jgi:hypothetical protein